MAQVTLRTIRYYDKHNILKPSFVTEAGARFYSDADFAKLQQILLLKRLGFSLEDIRQMTLETGGRERMLRSLELQKRLVQERIEQMQLVEKAIEDTTEALRTGDTMDWSRMLDLIHLTGMEKSLKNQYRNASNISARIHLHSCYAQNQQGWFPWIFEQCRLQPGMQILELGCGDGELWTESRERLPEEVSVVLSDISEGMLRDAMRSLAGDPRFCSQAFDCHRIPFEDDRFDLVIANHVLFYCSDLQQVCREVRRVLKPGGMFLCSTYGHQHMQEISRLVQSYDERIVLAADNLYEIFGRENGEEILGTCFSEVEWRRYEDFLNVTDAEPLISYILSCHGNQNQYLVDRYQDFHSFVKQQIGDGFHITKDAGIFLAHKNDKFTKNYENSY